MKDYVDLIIDEFTSKGSRLFSVTSIKDGASDERIITPSDNCHNSYSVAKAFTVTALGMLYDEGKLDPSEKVCDILRKYVPEDYEPRWENITLDNLMLHRIGLEKGFLDIDVEDVNSYGTKDYLAYAFRRKLPFEPDVERVYSDAAYYILSRVVSEKSGETLVNYLMPRLFSKLDFHEVAWSACPFGYSMGATGLYIQTRDMAKLGQVYLDGGVWNGQRIISEKWVDTVLERGYELKKRAGHESWNKGGMHGQMLYLSREHNLVLAWHSFDTTRTSSKMLDILDI